jgi:hypothetical protein
MVFRPGLFRVGSANLTHRAKERKHALQTPANNPAVVSYATAHGSFGFLPKATKQTALMSIDETRFTLLNAQHWCSQMNQQRDETNLQQDIGSI